MKVVILAGGLGTRLSEETELIPKPMVEIGGKPILWHIMTYYSQFGINDFIIALGYKGEVIKKYFLDYHYLSGDININLENGQIDVVHKNIKDWKINLIDTGLETLTGGRLKRLEDILGDHRFMLTYGDGLSTVNIDKLLQFHEENGRLATVSAVRPPARFGGINFNNNMIQEFTEKPQIGEGWINGGFMVFEPGIFKYLTSDDDVLEIDLLEKLAILKQLSGFKHNGFWQCMDTIRDKHMLEKYWKDNNAPWKIWNDD